MCVICDADEEPDGPDFSQDWEDVIDERVQCDDCLGAGIYHDCGEDTCCCADPETQELVICRACNGTGYY